MSDPKKEGSPGKDVRSLKTSTGFRFFGFGLYTKFDVINVYAGVWLFAGFLAYLAYKNNESFQNVLMVILSCAIYGWFVYIFEQYLPIPNPTSGN